MKLFKTLLIVFLFISFANTNAQSSTVVNSEVGVFLGPAFMQSDFGESGEISSSSSNVGFDFGVAYIMDFTKSRYDSKFLTWMSEHYKQRFEISFSKTDLEHDGAPIENGSDLSIAQFEGMTGEVKLFNIGAFGEWYFINLNKASSKLAPYFLTGISYTSAKSSFNFEDGIINSPYNILTDFSSDDKNTTISFTYGLGLRYQLKNVDLVAEGRFQAFNSDDIDGLAPATTGNKNNDSQVLFKIGAIFHLN